jgi:ATP-dependent Lon protease
MELARLGARLAGDKDKITAEFSQLIDIAVEASFWARKENSTIVNKRYVQRAVDQKVYRSDLIAEKIREFIQNGTLLLRVDGEVVGQVNGLSVIQLGDYTFGRPMRLTASVGVGTAGIINIEREAELSGPIHNKGVLIISGYLHGQYAHDKPLVINASITFEQNYGGVDGDSASSTEIYTILSSLAKVPLKQWIAVTGSVNQKGEIQPIGGINQKIEGFFDICARRGLTGKQGVMIPQQNVKDLMLRHDVVEAVKNKMFHIYAIKTIDEGIEILTDMKAGKKLPDGSFEKDTFHYKVNETLKQYARHWKDLLAS